MTNEKANNQKTSESQTKETSKQNGFTTAGHKPVKEGYKGYQPVEGNLDSSNPPQGGSGVPDKTTGRENKTVKED